MLHKHTVPEIYVGFYSAFFCAFDGGGKCFPRSWLVSTSQRLIIFLYSHDGISEIMPPPPLSFNNETNKALGPCTVLGGGGGVTHGCRMNLGPAQSIGDPQLSRCTGIPSQAQELILADFSMEPDIAETINEHLADQQAHWRTLMLSLAAATATATAMDE